MKFFRMEAEAVEAKKGLGDPEMTLYEEVVTVSKIYLGPATEKSFAMQCKLLKKMMLTWRPPICQRWRSGWK